MKNDKEFQELIEDLQKKIDKDEEKTYSQKVIKEYRDPVNFGFIKNPDATGKLKGPCNDTMRIDLRIKNEIIKEACFWTDGCGASLACGNMLTSMIKDKSASQANNISSKKLLDTLGGLPKEHTHCAVLAVDTLHKSIKNYYKNKSHGVYHK